MKCLECRWESPNVSSRYCPNCGSDKFRNTDSLKSYTQPVDKPVDNFLTLKR